MELSFSTPAGRSCKGYLAEPGKNANGNGIVVIHELWGVAAPIRGIADRCAAEGYRALVPDLFAGQLARDVPHGLELMSKLDFAAAAAEEVRGAAQWLRREADSVAAIGYCMGGAIVILAAERVPELAAAVCFYGVPPLEGVDATRIRVPLLGHFAEHDEWCTPAKVDALEAKLRASEVSYEFHRYAAAHAFMNREGAGYSEAASELAWRRTRAFLSRVLQPAP